MSYVNGFCTSIVVGADAGVVVDSIHTGGVILTVVVFTVIGIHLTLLALEPRRTHTAAGMWRKTAIDTSNVKNKHSAHSTFFSLCFLRALTSSKCMNFLNNKLNCI